MAADTCICNDEYFNSIIVCTDGNTLSVLWTLMQWSTKNDWNNGQWYAFVWIGFHDFLHQLVAVRYCCIRLHRVNCTATVGWLCLDVTIERDPLAYPPNLVLTPPRHGMLRLYLYIQGIYSAFTLLAYIGWLAKPLLYWLETDNTDCTFRVEITLFT